MDSVSITDYNPDTVNVLTVHSTVMEDIVYRNDDLIWRFGEKSMEMDAVKYVTVTEETPSNTDTSTTDTDTETDTSTDDTTTETDTTTTETETTTKVEEVPCETPEEVQAFADREWAKIKRNNGHTIELKTQ